LTQRCASAQQLLEVREGRLETERDYGRVIDGFVQ
jgi:hypothetical protein